jgi:hypothetical protein
LELQGEAGVGEERLTRTTGMGFSPEKKQPGGARESIVDIQETDTYTPRDRCSTDLLTGVVQHPKN